MSPSVPTRQLIQRTWLVVLPVTQVMTALIYGSAAPGQLYLASALLFVAAGMALWLLQSLHKRVPSTFSERAWRGFSLAIVTGVCLTHGVIGAVFSRLPGDGQRMLVLVVLGFLATLTPSRGRGIDFWLAVPALLAPIALLHIGNLGPLVLPSVVATILGLLALYALAALVDRDSAPEVGQETTGSPDNIRPTFLTRLSHELRTPMAGIVGTTELLEREPLTEYQRRLVQTVRRSAEELLVVVNSVLDNHSPLPTLDEPACVPVPLEASRDGSREDASDTVLVVDDSELNQDVLCQQLRTLGMSADTAWDGLQGLAKWRRRRYAMVIADIQMPRLDGLDMTRLMRAEEARGGDGQRTPIIALSANAQRGGDDAAMAAGFDGYLTKPLMLRRLQETLNQWVDKTAFGIRSTGPRIVSDPLDREALIEMVGGNVDVVESVLKRFAVAGAHLVQEIVSATRDSDQLKALAHKLKGTARSVCAHRLGELAEKLETSSDASDIEALEKEWQGVSRALDRWRIAVSA
jgi:CheY-like chemotaxis protein/HPt (histidine-containing phosphotransfer) domain-containing protein